MEPELRASYTDAFEHAFDEKGRLTIPSEWRGAPFESRLFLFPSREGGIKVYPESWLSRLQKTVQSQGLKLGDPQRLHVEALARLAQAATLDPNGRITVKERLRRQAGLKKEAALIGCLDHFTIQSPEALQRFEPRITTLEDAAEALGL
ncbi:MAG: division/cell wall cluster transcriptional repressor MraZ [Verrucomicrobium sp.]|nr:division/cell wall cluster transcriptional repressor MraZ [Verrucomicrobium sp.]